MNSYGQVVRNARKGEKPHRGARVAPYTPWNPTGEASIFKERTWRPREQNRYPREGERRVGGHRSLRRYIGMMPYAIYNLTSGDVDPEMDKHINKSEAVHRACWRIFCLRPPLTEGRYGTLYFQTPHLTVHQILSMLSMLEATAPLVLQGYATFRYSCTQ